MERIEEQHTYTANYTYNLTGADPEIWQRGWGCRKKSCGSGIGEHNKDLN